MRIFAPKIRDMKLSVVKIGEGKIKAHQKMEFCLLVLNSARAPALPAAQLERRRRSPTSSGRIRNAAGVPEQFFGNEIQ